MQKQNQITLKLSRYRTPVQIQTERRVNPDSGHTHYIRNVRKCMFQKTVFSCIKKVEHIEFFYVDLASDPDSR